MQQLSRSAIGEPGSGSVLTLRGVEPELRAALEAEAARRGLSLNGVILELLRGSLGLSAEAPLNHDLDSLAGSWSRDEAEEFAAAVQDFEQIDPRLWQDEPDLP